MKTTIRHPQTIADAAAIVIAVCNEHEVHPDDLLGPSRLRPIVRARQEAMWRLWADLGLSLPQIGGLLDRDHTTVLHAIDKRRLAAWSA